MTKTTQNVTARQAWERPTLYRMDAADAQNTMGAKSDGMMAAAVS